MRFGLYLPPFGEYADPRRVADLAVMAEQAGWAGLFLWDHVLAVPGLAVADAWTTLAAIALRDELRRLGAPDGHDLVIRCALHRLDPAGRGAAVATFADCGVTWVLEGFSPRQAAEQVEAVVRGGPPAGPGGSAS